jgi:hypothetical protein
MKWCLVTLKPKEKHRDIFLPLSRCLLYICKNVCSWLHVYSACMLNIDKRTKKILQAIRISFKFSGRKKKEQETLGNTFEN